MEDMDMDIPDPEELEWLESHASDLPYEDDFPELEPPEPEAEPNQPEPALPLPANPKPSLFLPPKPPSQPTIPKKRLRSHLSDHTQEPPNGDHVALDFIVVDEKRSRKEDKVDSEKDNGNSDDDDWLRYSPPHGGGDEAAEVVVQEEKKEKILSKYASEIEGDCVPVTGLDGERVYAKICRFEGEERLKRLNIKRGDSDSGLIPEPIRVLMERVENDEFTKVLQASAEVQGDISSPRDAVVNEQLWVDKYAPNSFVELLSDEQTNREVLSWLKQWDSCIFGSEIRSTTEDVLSALRRHSSGLHHSRHSTWSSSRNYRESGSHRGTVRGLSNLDQENGDKYIQDLHEKKHKRVGPPEQKILLLCGPPGLGKTTLAHVAARHCGYRVVEINASDDRSSSIIESKILDVVQMNSVIADSRPKCLVIDEIDGALGDGKGAVDVILKMATAERKSDKGKENIAQKENLGRKSKKNQNLSLLRPVICICNDLYAPVLRPLRQIAKVHIFVQPTVSRVVNRLKYICNKEGIKTSSIALTALAEYTECDIRSCLNTLQFLNRKKQNLNLLEVSSQVVGRKDVLRSSFDIWKEIFQKRKAKRERRSSSSSMSNDFEFLHSLIANRGDYDLILDGIHENILQLPYYDPVMQKTVKCLDNLGVSDTIHQYVMRTQKMSLKVYQPPTAIAIHALIAQVEKPNIEWPKSFQRYRTLSLEKMEIFQSWHTKITPDISRHLSTKSFVEDSISLLLHILSPPTLKPVALHLLSEKEKSNLAQLVRTMVSYAITYKNIKSDVSHGTIRREDALDVSMLSFEPPIGEFINFKGHTSCHYVLAPAVKQVLVHEVEKEKILQASINKVSTPTDNCTKENQTPGDKTGSMQSSKSHSATALVETRTNSRDLVKGKQYDLSTSSGPSTTETSRDPADRIKVTSDQNTKKRTGGSSSFFDRFRKLGSKGSQDTTNNVQRPSTSERDSRPLLFKFNEGFTNAVKRPVRIREFFL